MVVGEDGKRVDEWLELPNGCVCCSVRTDLVLTLENLVRRRDRFDYIFIETTGLADPGPLVSSLWLDEELGSNIYLDAIVTVVDVKFFEKSLQEIRKSGEVNEAQRQVAFADVLLLNKIDLVTEQEIKSLVERISQINPLAPTFRTTRSQVPLDNILNLHSFDMDMILKIDPLLSDLHSTCSHSRHQPHGPTCSNG
eukprot:TRINITY_DN3741_c0_g1_i1.p1 TRINITY_DN3741_c0_g1~~TRINITY_DN3741_c0_g1_i1.p1  ORF type:complete len:196 (+),score=40.63 TRINITY_DN3741_c0_g1_i1:136-723(+)